MASDYDPNRCRVGRRHFVVAIGAFFAAPFAADAQQARKVYRLGFLTQVEAHWLTDPFDAALRERGWIVGQNIFIERRAPGADTQRAVAMAQELVAQRVDVIVVAGTHMALAARRATINVPIVMLLSGYPVEAGLAASFARPGGNVTGLSTYGGEALFGKFMSLLRELLPSLRELAVIWDYVPPLFGEKEIQVAIGELRRAAAIGKLNTRLWMVRTESDLNDALAALAKAPAQALFVTSGPIHSQPPNRARLVEFSLRHRLPMMCDIEGSVFRAGGLVTYAVGTKEVVQRGADFVDRILRGAKAGELPIEQPQMFELTINLKTAKAIGLAIPSSLLVRADRVIE